MQAEKLITCGQPTAVVAAFDAYKVSLLVGFRVLMVLHWCPLHCQSEGNASCAFAQIISDHLPVWMKVSI